MSANAMKSTPAKTKVTKLIAMLEKDLAEKETYNKSMEAQYNFYKILEKDLDEKEMLNQSLEAQVRVLNDLVRNMAGQVVDTEAISNSLKQQAK